MIQFINLTPHTINIHGGTSTVAFARTGDVARVAMTEIPSAPIGGIPITRGTPGEVTGLPEPRKGVVFIVSAMVAAAVKRPDVLSPGPLIRDEEGRPIGCRGLRAH